MSGKTSRDLRCSGHRARGHRPRALRLAQADHHVRPGFPVRLRRLRRTPGGARVGARGGARDRGRGDRRRPVRAGGRVRAAEAGAEAGGVRGRRARRPDALDAVPRRAGRDGRDGRDAVPAVLDDAVLLLRPRGAAHRAVPEPAGRRDAVHRHRSQGREPLRPHPGRPAGDLPRGRRRLGRRARRPGARRGVLRDAAGDPRAGRRHGARDLEPAGAAAGRHLVLRLPGREPGLQVLPAPRGLRPGRLRHRRLGHGLPELDAGDPARRLHRRRRPPPRAWSAAASSCRWRCGRRPPTRSRTGRPAPRCGRCTRTATRAPP